MMHPLKEHLARVSELARTFLEEHPAADEAALAGLLHDLGKYGDLFQKRLRGKEQGLDHWSQGAWLALTECHAIAAALAIQGHHIGLQSLSTTGLKQLCPEKLADNHPLQLRLSEKDIKMLKDRLAADGLKVPAVPITILGTNIDGRIDCMLDVRMLFSALADADFLDTEAHFQGDTNGKRYRDSGPQLSAQKALNVLLAEIEKKQRETTAADAVSSVRSSLLRSCLDAAEEKTGLFTLTAPTGSGKTLAMLAFALKHALEHELRRVVMVIPYLSIIEQTSDIYRKLFAKDFGENYVLEHHSLAGAGGEQNKTDNEAEGHEAVSAERQSRLLAENWDAPLIVTTSVQMLESLFSNRPSACRKLHRLARSVILFDEVQTLAPSLAVPTLAALSHLADKYRSTVVFATATQPPFNHLHDAVTKHCKSGWEPREIVKEPVRLFTQMRRTRVHWGDPDKGTAWEEMAQRLKEHKQAMCIVNLKRHAKTLWETLRETLPERTDGAVLHLSTHLCPAHRRMVLETLRKRLEAGETVLLVTTQCVEAGVDLDFPVVYRAYAPLEAIIQAAGRCNREGRRKSLGEVHVFLPQDDGYPPGVYRQATQVTRMLLKHKGSDCIDLDDPEFITAYYRQLYDLSRPDEAARTREILDAVKAGSFPEIAQKYRLIDEDAINVVAPYAERLQVYTDLYKQAGDKGLSRDWIQKARDLTVSLYRPKRNDPVWDALIPIKVAGRQEREQNEWFIYAVKEHYHPELGLLPSGSLNNWIA
jgi:CRISPR-associated helicase Cas3/CRISPR-associated endonuclease Cas3-HD